MIEHGPLLAMDNGRGAALFLADQFERRERGAVGGNAAQVPEWCEPALAIRPFEQSAPEIL